jgi:hypothetical protein
MTEDNIKQFIRNLIEIAGEEQDVVPVQFIVDGIQDACAEDQRFLAHDHVQATVKLLQEVCVEEGSPVECQCAYVIRRGDEDVVVPCLELTDAELKEISRGWRLSI